MALRGGRNSPGQVGVGPESWAGAPGETALRLVPRRRAALNGRALIGGLLVAVSGVGLFAAYTQAGADHRTAYVVAARDLQPGQRVGVSDLTTARMQLPGALAAEDAFRDITPLEGSVMVAPLRAGELVQASDVVAAADAPAQQEVSFSIDPARAVDGTLRPGETVAVLATYGTGTEAVTLVVVPLAEVVSVDQTTATFGTRTGESITLGLSTTSDVMAVTNAVNAAQVELVRTQTPDDATAPYHAGSAS